MYREEIMNTLRTLGRAQGSYNRMYRQLRNLEDYDCEKFNELMSELEEQNFQSPIDLVMYLES